MIQALKKGLLHLFYPHLCYGCNKPLLAGEDVLCLHCGLMLPATSYHDIADNETAQRFAGRLPFVYATSYAHFTNDGLLQHLLHGLKYKNRQDIGRYLGRQFARELQDTQWIKDINGIVAVPLHPRKEAVRGYNQSVLLAQGMGEVLQLPVLKNVLQRVRHTESQTQKTRAQRIVNMQNAFVVNEKKLKETRHVLLLDDVLTTGATLEACAMALLNVKGVEVSIATIGIAD
ncbi:MAG: phosphoribosyltransferase family protein [Flavipsychrobacter sp.]|nr:phosphoribosyltransferase family protein [Flavipsychrobacter sp.]